MFHRSFEIGNILVASFSFIINDFGPKSIYQKYRKYYSIAEYYTGYIVCKPSGIIKIKH